MKLTTLTYPDAFVLRSIHSTDESLALWGGLQRLKKLEHPSQLVELLELPIPLVQEMAMTYLATLDSAEAKGLVPFVVTLFRESNGRMKYQSAYCLAHFPSDFTHSLLSKWANVCLESEESTRFEMEAAIISWLKVDPKVTDILLERLVFYQDNPMSCDLLFRHLLPHCIDKDRFARLIDFYFYTRDRHANLENTRILMERLVEPEIMAWVSQSLLRGNTIEHTFSQLCTLIAAVPEMRWRTSWEMMDQAGVRLDGLTSQMPDSPEILISGVKSWLEVIEPTPSHPIATWLVGGFERNLAQFGASIPRLVEYEVIALLSLVPSLLVQRSIDRWLLKPASSLEAIANFYHSPLISMENQNRVLQFFFPKAPDWGEAACQIEGGLSPVSLSATKAEVLWQFFKGDLLGTLTPWPTLFPNPGGNSRLSAGLVQIYLTNFEMWIQQKDHVNIDYGLQLFQLHPCLEVQDLLLAQFQFLQRYHTELLYQLLELSPDQRIIDHLIGIYQPGEFDLARLIAFLCHAYDVDLPVLIEQDVDHRASLYQIGHKKPVRLTCSECGHNYQYFAEVIYVDEGDIMRTGRLSSQSLWTPNPFFCKGCGARLPFELDEGQLEELTLQSKVDRLLRQSSNQSGFGQRIMLVEFPRHHTQSYNPEQFQALIEASVQSTSVKQEERDLLFLKAARMYKGLSEFHNAIKSLAKLEPIAPQYQLESSFIKGVCYFRIGDYPKARVHFDFILDYYMDQTEQPYLEETKSFLKSMSENRQRFLLIQGHK